MDMDGDSIRKKEGYETEKGSFIEIKIKREKQMKEEKRKEREGGRE